MAESVTKNCTISSSSPPPLHTHNHGNGTGNRYLNVSTGDIPLVALRSLGAYLPLRKKRPQKRRIIEEFMITWRLITNDWSHFFLKCKFCQLLPKGLFTLRKSEAWKRCRIADTRIVERSTCHSHWPTEDTRQRLMISETYDSHIHVVFPHRSEFRVPTFSSRFSLRYVMEILHHFHYESICLRFH